MKIRERAIRELECMNSIESMVIYDLILSLKKREAREAQTKYAKSENSKSYINNYKVVAEKRGLSRFCGKWQDGKSADDIVSDIYAERKKDNRCEINSL